MTCRYAFPSEHTVNAKDELVIIHPKARTIKEWYTVNDPSRAWNRADIDIDIPRMRMDPCTEKIAFILSWSIWRSLPMRANTMIMGTKESKAWMYTDKRIPIPVKIIYVQMWMASVLDSCRTWAKACRTSDLWIRRYSRCTTCVISIWHTSQLEIQRCSPALAGTKREAEAAVLRVL